MQRCHIFSLAEANNWSGTRNTRGRFRTSWPNRGRAEKQTNTAAPTPNTPHATASRYTDWLLHRLQDSREGIHVFQVFKGKLLSINTERALNKGHIMIWLDCYSKVVVNIKIRAASNDQFVYRDFTSVLTLTKHLQTKLMFCWAYIVVNQYSKTNVMQYLFSLLRVKGVYMFRSLLAHLQ
jgi:hypothetical protein